MEIDWISFALGAGAFALASLTVSVLALMVWANGAVKEAEYAPVTKVSGHE